MSRAAAITISNIGGGVIPERFAHELAKIVENIRDVNTDSKAKRSITLKVVFTPH